MHVADPHEAHTSKAVDRSRNELRTYAVEIGGPVIDRVGRAVQALLERDLMAGLSSAMEDRQWKKGVGGRG